jgi:hypothetical protein
MGVNVPGVHRDGPSQGGQPGPDLLSDARDSTDIGRSDAR